VTVEKTDDSAAVKSGMCPIRVVSLGRELGGVIELDLLEGEVHFQPVVGEGVAELFRAIHVSFRPGARTRWHRHSSDQLLVITAGCGIVADEAGEREVRPGDVVFVPRETRHWHGAGADSDMSHLSITTPGIEMIDEPEPPEAVDRHGC
jgi:quercetin dioxygenase-like cupin family protein